MASIECPNCGLKNTYGAVICVHCGQPWCELTDDEFATAAARLTNFNEEARRAIIEQFRHRGLPVPDQTDRQTAEQQSAQCTGASRKMDSWQVVLTGWITFLVGHSVSVAVRARLLAAYDKDFVVNRALGNPPPSESVFWVVDGAIVATAMIMIIIGTSRMPIQPTWKPLIVLLALALQFWLALCVYVILIFIVHLGFGGPL
jgi:hypothetical protein